MKNFTLHLAVMIITLSSYSAYRFTDTDDSFKSVITVDSYKPTPLLFACIDGYFSEVPTIDESEENLSLKFKKSLIASGCHALDYRVFSNGVIAPSYYSDNDIPFTTYTAANGMIYFALPVYYGRIEDFKKVLRKNYVNKELMILHKWNNKRRDFERITYSIENVYVAGEDSTLLGFLYCLYVFPTPLLGFLKKGPLEWFYLLSHEYFGVISPGDGLIIYAMRDTLQELEKIKSYPALNKTLKKMRDNKISTWNLYYRYRHFQTNKIFSSTYSCSILSTAEYLISTLNKIKRTFDTSREMELLNPIFIFFSGVNFDPTITCSSFAKDITNIWNEPVY